MTTFLQLGVWTHLLQMQKKLELGAPSWLVFLFGQSIAPVSQRLMVRIPYKPELYQSGFLL